MDRFIPHTDKLGTQIQAQSEQLFADMQAIDVNTLGLSEHGEIYFKKSHSDRLFFSIQTSAHILYNSITLSKKPVHEIVILDYGAGIGTLYILAKMIGCKKVIYNDILQDWKNNAQIIAKAINKDVDEYIVGNIDDTLLELKQKGIVLDILTSRNVIEHIYKLDAFYKVIYQFQPQTIIYSSTTANFLNPATNIQHILHHIKTEKIFRAKRLAYIQSKYPSIPNNTQVLLSQKTQGYDRLDMEVAIEAFLSKGKLPTKAHFYTNTCDVDYGLWAENLLTYGIHKKATLTDKQQTTIKPGFWDTHNKKPWKNLLGYLLNPIIKWNETIGCVIAPFIYIIVTPIQDKVD